MASIISPSTNPTLLARECGSYIDKMRPPLELDLRSLKCPLPVLRTRKALRGLAPGDRIVVTCTDPLASIDIPHLVQCEGHDLDCQSVSDGVARFVIVKGGA